MNEKEGFGKKELYCKYSWMSVTMNLIYTSIGGLSINLWSSAAVHKSVWQLCAAMMSWVGQWVELVVYQKIQCYQTNES